MKAIRLQTEYMTEPQGIDIVNPRLFWNCEDGVHQSAYRIVARRGDEIIWDSGKVESDSMTHIPYEGKPLHSRDIVVWTVTLWDENNRPGEETSSWFELGLLEESDWTAKWIAGDYKPRKNHRYPADCFRKEFYVKKGIQKARLYITACGLYEAKINGKRVGDFVLAPGCTDYSKRLQYQTYDVTELLRSENSLEAQLADGWYRGSIGAYGQTVVFGRQTKLLCQLEITYFEGITEIIGSDNTFEWTNDGPIRFADLKDGEIFDASLKPTYARNAIIVQETIKPTASNNVPVREKEHFHPTISVAPSGRRILDFGQNIAGFIAFRIRGIKGKNIKLRLGETLDGNGELIQKNMQLLKPASEYGKIKATILMFGLENKILHEPMQATPMQEINFICSGEEDTYKTTFAVFGFRYCEIDSEIDIQPENFEAIAVYSDMEQTGLFSCSNDKINQLFSNTLWSMKGNFLDIPTDCPTRERAGWTGDAQVFFNTGAYLMNTAPFFRKWLLDLQLAQMKNGIVPSVVPAVGNNMIYTNTGVSVGWADAIVLLPYRYWKCYGDIKIADDCYDMMRRYAMYMIKNTGHKDKKKAKENPYNKYVYEKGVHLGEWLEPGEFKESGFDSRKPHPEECTAYLHYTMLHMKEIAKELGKAEDEKLFYEYCEGAKKAYNWLFFKNGVPDTDRQAKLVRPLALGLADGKIKIALEKRLVQAVMNRGYCIATGFLSTPFLLSTLTKGGRVDLAYKMLENEEAPSWLYQINHGATTIWEEWEGISESQHGSGSLNHYSYGAVCQWLFETVAGIRVDGKKHFTIAPIPGGTLKNAQANYISPYGMVESQWETDGRTTKFRMVIPSNTSADIILPNGQTCTVGTGIHEYTL